MIYVFFLLSNKEDKTFKIKKNRIDFFIESYENKKGIFEYSCSL